MTQKLKLHVKADYLIFSRITPTSNDISEIKPDQMHFSVEVTFKLISSQQNVMDKDVEILEEVVLADLAQRGHKAPNLGLILRTCF